MVRRGRRTPTATAQAGRDVSRRQTRGVKSRLASTMLHELYHSPVPARRDALRLLLPDELTAVLTESQRELGVAYGLWHDTPSGFTEDVVGDTIWSAQRRVLDAVITHTRVIVPAGMGVGKTWLAGRLVGWAGSVNPPGSMVIVTTATRFRQVKRQMWPHIRNTIAKGGLPGWTDTSQWKQIDSRGTEKVVAYGFTTPNNDEAAMQGIHGTPKLLLIVDEAGGISRLIGRATNNLLTGDARMLAIGNPAMNDARTWFEAMCEEGEKPSETKTTTIRIATTDSPPITGEPTPVCRECTYNPERHDLGTHLPDQDWLDRTLREYGSPKHPYIVAKVNALFPKDTGSQAIPASWVEAATKQVDPEGEGWVTIASLGLPGEDSTNVIKMGSWVRLGVDVAADGGDEFVICRAVGDLVEFRYASIGSQNANQVTLAEKLLEEIHAAVRLAKAIGSPRKVRTKIDKNGLGYGLVGMLETWGTNKWNGNAPARHTTEIVGVMVSENPDRDDPAAPLRPRRKRDEMWIGMRQLVEPQPTTGPNIFTGKTRVRLDVGPETIVQLSVPELTFDTNGFAVIESKKSMKTRGVASPDRAEAAILATYEPFPLMRRRKRGLIG